MDVILTGAAVGYAAYVVCYARITSGIRDWLDWAALNKWPPLGLLVYMLECPWCTSFWLSLGLHYITVMDTDGGVMLHVLLIRIGATSLIAGICAKCVVFLTNADAWC